MPLIQRPAGNVGRNAQSGMSDHERIMANLKAAKDEIERLRSLNERTNQKLNEATRNNSELKVQLSGFKEQNQHLKQEAESLVFENSSWETKYKELRARYENLELRHNALKDPSPTNPMASPLPDRTKKRHSHKPSKDGDSREHREDKNRDRDRDRDRDRGRGRDREKLLERFSDRRPPTTTRHIEGWGPGGRSASATPASRNNYTSVASGRNRETTYETPRTANPMSPTSTGFHSSSGSSAMFDDERAEDGNYHQYPVTTSRRG
jgi:regulator of replication initiation timing